MKYLILVVLISVLLTPPVSANYNYSEVLEKSLLFYEAQRSGVLPPDNRIPYRGDSFLTDQGHDGEDLSGGYFHSKDLVKFSFPGTSAMVILAWGMLDSRAGYVRAGQWENALSALRWGMDYYVKTNPSRNVLYVQVANATEDRSFFGRPEEWTGSDPRRVLQANRTHPASEVAATQSAAMAAASMVFRENGDTTYANTLLVHATQLYDFATTFRGHYNESFPEVANYYNSWSGFSDEFLYAAAWLFRATGKNTYRVEYNRWWTEFGLSWRPSDASWDMKLALAQILLAKIDGSPQYVNAARTFCDWLVNEAPRTPLGRVHLAGWAPNRHAANVAFVCLQATSVAINPEVYIAFAKSQIDYMLGDTGRSFVVGFGENFPQFPFHAASTCPDRPATCDWNTNALPEPNHQILYGALVGGPDINDDYIDARNQYNQNGVGIEFNAGFQSAVAELCTFYCD